MLSFIPHFDIFLATFLALEATLERLHRWPGPDRIVVLTSEDQEATVSACCPDWLPASAVVAEVPLGKRGSDRSVSRQAP